MSRHDLGFEFSATDDVAGGKALLSGIPAPLWLAFVENAKKAMPEKGDNAWSAVLAECIASVGGGGNTYTLILTDIPIPARDALEKIAEGVGSSSDQLIALLYHYAQESSLHMLRIKSNDNTPQVAMIITGIPERAWAAWATVAKGVNELPETLFGRLLQQAELGGLTYSKVEDGVPPNANAKVGANGVPKPPGPAAFRPPSNPRPGGNNRSGPSGDGTRT